MKTAQNTLACALRSYFTDYLPKQRAISPHTLSSYRDSLKLFMQFVAGEKADPCLLMLEKLSAEQVSDFLQYLEDSRHNLAATRNVRLSAIHSFFRYVGVHHPQYLEQSQRILSVPFKRKTTRQIEHFEFSEIQALLSGIDRSRADGCRDYAMVSFMFNTGARVSEFIGLHACDLRLIDPASVLLRGKGRKERTCPLWPETARALRDYLEQRALGLHEARQVFLNHRGQPLTRFGARLIVQKLVRATAIHKPSLKQKRLHPHSFRHSTAIHLLKSGVDLCTISHWLGHCSVNTTNKYLELDLETKREALKKVKPIAHRNGQSGRWHRDPNLIKWLESL
jgi:integrase/recombinase XerD